MDDVVFVGFFALVIGLIGMGAVISIDGIDGEITLMGERFVRVGAEQEDEEMWCEEWVYEEYEKLSCKAAIKVDGDVLGAEPCGSGGQTCCRFYINESDVVENDKQDYRLCQDWHQECVSESLVRRRC